MIDVAEAYVGMRVSVEDNENAGTDGFPANGSTGTIIAIEKYDDTSVMIGVQFDLPFPEGHDCSGKSADGCGRWYYPFSDVVWHDWTQMLSPCDGEENDITESDDLLDFIGMFGEKSAG